ncbi:uncharacterized protein BDZ99DRAFT_498614 [Mytilinidion resinicola]|uniref:Tail specific protease domain-containing protein n=1 Tax=Mytilinidion resinicola TaxID=574789 RepID=A0A6A6YPN6_9PEZI|nr:uncharacterized protein BDZ99DRAFT_498614 [Mytilinidion resinicola]KAF2810488.1 hypothetical protein BDZ99DRAFT_498614 [Mytilinidion resinicola]
MRPADFIRAGIGFSSTFFQSTVPINTKTASIASLPSSTPSGSVEPCSLIAKYGGAGSRLPAQVAYACLVSVPVDVEGDSQLIDDLKILWEWHSETGWLKNTPSTWELGPLDVIKELDAIQGNLSNYRSEYEVQRDIKSLATRSGNGHFRYQPDILQVFAFYRDSAIASISDDGNSLPKVYDATDLEKQQKESDIKISAISKINGKDIESFLEEIASDSYFTNLDARVNSLFLKEANGSLGSFYNQEAYQEDWTNVTFANGTTKNSQNLAVVYQNITNTTDGPSFYRDFCRGQISGFRNNSAAPSAILKKATPIEKRASIPSIYPTSVVEDSTGAVAGYFLDDSGFEDLAILKIATFFPHDPTGRASQLLLSKTFQFIVAQFMREAAAANKTKLIIDLRENGGGHVHLVLDTLMQLFPGETPFAAHRYRAQEQFLLIGDRVSEIHHNETMSIGFLASGYDVTDTFRHWAYWHFLDVNNKNFASWKEFYGPHTYNNDTFTTTIRYNLSNSDRISTLPPDGFPISNTTKAQFQFSVDNTVMMLDGLCGSACAFFHEELKNVAGVKSVVIGGRPQTGPMQALGGTKGGEVISTVQVQKYGEIMLEATKLLGATTLSGTVIEKLANTNQALVRIGDGQSCIQTQDEIRKGDDTEAPLQYTYEAADCRLWLTSEMLFNPTAAWEAVWSAHTNNSLCVKNSTGDKSSISGGFKPFGRGSLHGKMKQETPTNTTNKPSSPTSTSAQTSSKVNAAAPLGPQSLGFLVAVAVALVAL